MKYRQHQLEADRQQNAHENVKERDKSKPKAGRRMSESNTSGLWARTKQQKQKTTTKTKEDIALDGKVT